MRINASQNQRAEWQWTSISGKRTWKRDSNSCRLSACVLCGSPVWPSPPVVGLLWGPPLCVGLLWVGSPSCRVLVSRGICSSSCLSLVLTLYDEYAERGQEYGIPFIFTLFYEYIPPYTGFTRRNALFIFVWLCPRNT